MNDSRSYVVRPDRKRWLCAIAVGLLSVSLLPGACGADDQPADPPSTSSSQPAEDEYVAWMKQFIRLKGTEDDAIAAGTKVASLVDRPAGAAEVLEAAVVARTAFRDLGRRANRQLPASDDRRVTKLNRTFASGVRAYGQAMAALVDAVKASPSERSARLVDRYARLRKLAVSRLVTTGKSTVELYSRFGGETRLGERLPLSDIGERA